MTLLDLAGDAGTAFDRALDAAKAEGRLLLVVQDPPWTNGARRLAFLAGQDGALKEAIAAQARVFELDPYADPRTDERLRVAVALERGALSAPLITLVSPDGAALASFASIAFEGEPDTPTSARLPSLAAMIKAAAEQAAGSAAGPPDLDESVPGLDAPPRAGRLAFVEEPPPRDLGAFHLLNLAEGGQRDRAEVQMTKAVAGGVWDHVFGGFHRAARENRLVRPQFEKVAVHNLAMALVLARLAESAPLAPRLAVARDRLLAFLAGLFSDGGDVVAEESDTQRHTWVAREFNAAVRPDASYIAGIHFGIANHATPQVLYESRPREMTAATCGVDPARVDEVIAVVEARLAAFKGPRRPPVRVRSADPADRLANLWLALKLAEQTGTFVLGGDPGEAAARASASEDTAGSDPMSALALRLLVADHAAGRSGDAGASDRVAELAARLRDRHVEAPTGWCRDEAGAPARLAVFDGLRLPAAGLVAAALCAAGDRLGALELREAGERVAERYRRIAALRPAYAQAFLWLAGDRG